MPDELTQNQSYAGTSFSGDPMVGGYGLGGYYTARRSDTGTLLLPEGASQRGSGAMEGRNSYDNFGVMGDGGYGPLGYLPGTFQTYRYMRSHPTIALARATVVGPIVAAGWNYEETEGKAPAKARELIESVLAPIRSNLMLSLLRALDYGYQSHEIVWGDSDDGYRVPVKFKELRHEWNQFEIDKLGNVVAIKNQKATVPTDRLLLYSHDAEYGDPHGRARLENIRRTWCNWLATEDQRYRLAQKAAGIVLHVGAPPDRKGLATGETTNYTKAVAIAQALSQGRSVVYPTTGGLQVDDIKDAIDLSGKSLFPIELLDMGDTGPATQALDATLKYYDQLLCRGYLRSERSVIEATGGGTRAESADHTANISDTDCDSLHEEIVRAINAQVVDPILIENFGPSAKGTVRVKANELVDENAIIDGKMLDALLNNQMTMGELFSRVDMEAWCQRVGISLKEGHEPFDEMAGQEAEEPDNGQRGPDDDEDGDTDR